MAVQRIDITAGTIWRVVLILVVVGFVYLIKDFLLLLFGAIIFSAAIEPVANWLEKFRVPRALSTGAVFILVGGLVALVVTLMIPPFTEQSQQLIEALPHIVERLERQLDVLPEGTKDQVVSSIRGNALSFGDRLGNVGLSVVYQTRSVISNVLSLFFFLVIAFYLTVERRALNNLAKMTVSKKHLAYVESRIDQMKKRIGLWLIGQMSLAVIMGVLSGVGLWMLGVKYALVLGIIAGILELVPVLGPIISGTLATVLTLTQSAGLGLAVLIFYVVIQQLEGSLLIPHVMRRATGLHPLVIIIAVLLGARLVGIVGVILAVPTATIVVMLWRDVFSPGTGR